MAPSTPGSASSPRRLPARVLKRESQSRQPLMPHSLSLARSPKKATGCDVAIQKPEWFKMDPAKFFSDAKVDVMTTLGLGGFLMLMCRQWLDGFIPDDQKMLARLCRLDAAAMAEAWITLSHFFPIG